MAAAAVYLLKMVCLISSVLAGASALAAPRDTVKVTGIKWPNSFDEGVDPVVTEAQSLVTTYGKSTGFDQLLPYILASPDQEDAGSCLYMSLTGIAEWWLARLHPTMSRAPDGPLDLSERYLMNLAGVDEDKDPHVANWKTDSVYLFNLEHRGVLNTSYRFTKGWYTNSEGQYSVLPANRDTPGAEYGALYNWVDEHHNVAGGYVALPTFNRRVIFADPASDQWNVGVAPQDIVGKVKAALIESQAPVHVIYNHFGYWHAVNIVGFDDEMDNGHCAFVTDTIKYLEADQLTLAKRAELAGDETASRRFLDAAKRKQTAYTKLTKAYHDQGGCHGRRGMFYVRDSIYAADSEPVYRYNLTQPGDEGHYSKKVVLHEYDWLLYLANHVTQIGIEPGSEPALR